MTRRSPMGFWLFLGIAGFVAATVAGLQTAQQSAERRELFQRLSASQDREDEHLREYRLLLLERATLAGYQNVEVIAKDQLGMRFPDQPDDVVRVIR